jgi:signal transduction histidine kinase
MTSRLHSFAPSQAGLAVGLLRAHTLLRPLAFALGLLLVVIATIALVKSTATAPAPAATGPRPGGTTVERVRTNQAWRIHATADGILLGFLVIIWALTAIGHHSDFWPVWVALPLALALSIHGWVVATKDNVPFVNRFLGSRAFAIVCGIVISLSLFYVGIWAASGGGSFWPVWPTLAHGLFVAAFGAALLLNRPREAQLTERIDVLEETRAGAVDEQESELRRIERDLHDGAQARLVALGMSLGMAEQRLSEDPERAGELLAEARAGAEQALRELRDLARGIHPPVLTDRGLAAALSALTDSTPIPVTLDVALPRRPPPAVESAAYFVAAEALANAGKYSHAERITIRIDEADGVLTVAVHDDGQGGADPDGGGLAGLRRRVQALDGRLRVISPLGGPTTIRAELPCAS